MTRRTRKTVKHACDRLWSLLVRARAGGRCEHCASYGVAPGCGRLEAHHVYGRGNHRLRFELRNGVALGTVCHRWAGENPLPFTHWFERVRGDDAAFLAVENRRGLVKRSLGDYLALEGELKGMLEQEQEAA